MQALAWAIRSRAILFVSSFSVLLLLTILAQARDLDQASTPITTRGDPYTAPEAPTTRPFPEDSWNLLGSYPQPGEKWTDVTTPALGDPGWGHGMAWVDYDNDGDLDLYVTNRTSENILYRNDGPAAELLVEATPEILADSADCRGAAWGDYDNDGDLDLYVTILGPNRLFRNDGGGSFVDVTASPLDDSDTGQTASWADYDNDGDLDLFLVDNGANNLFRNDGGGTFTDVTSGAVADSGFGMGCGWADYDNDGDLDIYIANYEEANLLLRNDGGDVFVDATTPVLEMPGPSAGVAWGDYDNDKDLDLYVTNDGPNKLLRNDAGTFTDVTIPPLDGFPYGRSAAWGDYDLDGHLDLYLVNWGWPNKLLRNTGGGTFHDWPSGPPPLGDSQRSFSTAWADWDQDGDLDLFLVNRGTNRLFRNDLVCENHWLEVGLVGVFSNASGQGARVRIIVAGSDQMREIAGASGYLSQGPLTAFFGVGKHDRVNVVEVTWPSGVVQYRYNIPADQKIQIVEAIEPPSTGIADPMVAPLTVRLDRISPNPFRAATAVRYDLLERADVRLAIYDISGRLIVTLTDRMQEAGYHTAYWDGTNAWGKPVAPGIYFCKLSAGINTQTQRLMLLR